MPTAPHRPALRRVTAADAPLPGVLLPPDRDDESETLVWTDIDLWREHPAWSADPDGHLFAPRDVGRGHDGDGVLVPHCPMRVRAWVDGRLTVPDAEAATVAVSLLRGAAEADALGIADGTWWLTSAGRPVLAAGGTRRWRLEADAVLSELAHGATPSFAALLIAAGRALGDPNALRREISAHEAALFAAVPPAPLVIDHIAVRSRAVTVPTRGAAATGDRDAFPTPATPSGPAERVPFVTAAFGSLLDAEWAERIQRAWKRLRASLSRESGARVTSPRHSRARVVAVGTAVFAAVVGGSLLLSDDSRTDVAAGAAPAHDTASPARSATATPSAGGSDADGDGACAASHRR